MRILSRYMSLRFLGPFLFGLGTFALLVFLGDLFDKLKQIINSPADGRLITEYLLLQAPYWAVRIVPMATLLAALFAVTGFVSSGEFVAVQAAGIPARSFFIPLLWMALAASALTFIAQETVLPLCRGRAQELWREKIQPSQSWDVYKDRVLVVGADRLISVAVLNVKDGIMERPVLDDYGPRGLVRQIDAALARWDAGKRRWVFETGVERTFEESGAVAAERPFSYHDSDLSISPRSLRPWDKESDEMSLRETVRLARRLRELGQPAHKAKTAIQSKLSYPFTNLILCALGIPIALRLRRASKPVSFGAALVVGFLYLWFIEMGTALGNSGRVPPIPAAWMANALFGGLAVWMYRRIEL